jgi:glycerol uptake facilitator-like aquaporin
LQPSAKWLTNDIFEEVNKDQKARGASDWSNAMVPVLGPLIGGGLAGMFLRAIAKYG